MVSRSNLAHSLDVISLPLEFSSVKHLCDLMGVEKITKIIVGEVIDKIVAKKIGETKIAFSSNKKHTLCKRHK